MSTTATGSSPRSTVLVMFIGSALLAACGEGVLETPQTSQKTDPLNSIVTFPDTSCTGTEKALIEAAADAAYFMVVTDPTSLQERLVDSFHVSPYHYALEYWIDWALRDNVSTAVKCVWSCQGEDSCSPGGTGVEEVHFTHSFLQQYSTDLTWIAARMLGEIANNHTFEVLESSELPFSPRNVVAYAADPSKNSGTAKPSALHGEVELTAINYDSMHDHSGCGPNSFLRGLDVHPTGTFRINALTGYCDPFSGKGSSSFRIGDPAGAMPYYVGCPAGYRATGVHGRSTLDISQLGLLCTPSSTLLAGQSSTHVSAGVVGGYTSSDKPYIRKCPDGMAIDRIRFFAWFGISNLGIVCRDVNEKRAGTFSKGPVWGATFSEPQLTRQCTGFGAMTGIFGRGGYEIDALGGHCVGTRVLDTRWGKYLISDPNTEHVLRTLGGDGGYSFNITCPTYELMVGLAVKAGPRIAAIRPICASPAQWEYISNPETHWMGWAGTPSQGQYYTYDKCKRGSYVVGFENKRGYSPYTSGTVHGMRIICRDLI